MATITNRSRFRVTVKNRNDLEQTYPYSSESKVKDYFKRLKDQGFSPKISRLDDSFEVKIRQKGFKDQNLTVSSYEDAELLITQIESERKRGLFIDYTKGWNISFADLLRRYLLEEAPRLKSFETLAYRINAMLKDAGHSREDIAEILAGHRNHHPSLNKMRQRKAVGNVVRKPLDSLCWLNKPFAQIVPDDINDYIEDRCQDVEPGTVDREVDIFSRVCSMAIDSWRIPIAMSPMHGVNRPAYFNERDRRVREDEEAILMAHALEEDHQRSIQLRLEELMSDVRATAALAPSLYAKKNIIKEALATLTSVAESTYELVPLLATFIQFQLQTGARRGETLSLTWENLDLERQTAFLPETKNGRPRKLSLRQGLVSLLQQLPRDSALVFPISVSILRKAWTTICEQAGFTGEKEMRIHDLRHEAISRVADTGTMSLVDLQAFSGHKDVRMLLRYAHLCAENMAKRLDEAFSSKKNYVIHRGTRRLKRGGIVTIKELVTAPLQTAV
jgi:integrase